MMIVITYGINAAVVVWGRPSFAGCRRIVSGSTNTNSSVSGDDATESTLVPRLMRGFELDLMIFVGRESSSGLANTGFCMLLRVVSATQRSQARSGCFVFAFFRLNREHRPVRHMTPQISQAGTRPPTTKVDKPTATLFNTHHR